MADHLTTVGHTSRRGRFSFQWFEMIGEHYDNPQKYNKADLGVFPGLLRFCMVIALNYCYEEWLLLRNNLKTHSFGKKNGGSGVRIIIQHCPSPNPFSREVATAEVIDPLGPLPLVIRRDRLPLGLGNLFHENLLMPHDPLPAAPRSVLEKAHWYGRCWSRTPEG